MPRVIAELYVTVYLNSSDLSAQSVKKYTRADFDFIQTKERLIYAQCAVY